MQGDLKRTNLYIKECNSAQFILYGVLAPPNIIKKIRISSLLELFMEEVDVC